MSTMPCLSLMGNASQVEKRVSSGSGGSSGSMDTNSVIKVITKRPLPRHLTSNHTLQG